MTCRIFAGFSLTLSCVSKFKEVILKANPRKKKFKMYREEKGSIAAWQVKRFLKHGDL